MFVIPHQSQKKIIVVWLNRIIEFSLYVMIFTLPFSKTIVEISFGCMLGGWILKRFLTRESKSALVKAFNPVRTSLNWPIAGFVLVGFLSIFASVSLSLSLEGFFCKLLEGVMVYFILAEVIDSRGKLYKMLLTIFSSMVLISINGMFQFVTGTDFIRHFYLAFGQKMLSSFGNPNDFAAWLIVMVFLSLSLAYLGKDKWLKLYWMKEKIARSINFVLWGLNVFLIVCLALTYSRGALIAVVFASFFIGIFRSWKLFMIVIFTLLVLSFTVLCFQKEGSECSILSGEGKGFVMRTILWREGLNIVKDFPVLGSGLNTYAVVAPKYKLSEKTGIYPHNSYLHMAAETGLVGLGAFLWIIWVLFRTSIRNLKKIKDKFYNAVLIGLLSGLFGFLIHSFVDTNFYSLQLSVLMWYVMGLIVAVQRIAIGGCGK